MYYIEKIPSPRGYINLSEKIKIDNVWGIDEVYTVDGELRGLILMDENPEKEVTLEVVYTRKYNDGTTKDFIAIERLDNGHPDFSLSKVPIISSSKRKLLSIDILARRIGE